MPRAPRPPPAKPDERVAPARPEEEDAPARPEEEGAPAKPEKEDALQALDAAHAAAAWRAIDAYYDGDPYFLTRHHLDSYDAFLQEGALRVVRSMNPLTMTKQEGGRAVRVDVRIGERGLRVDRPTVVGADGAQRPLFPNEARLKDLTYGARLYADLSVTYSVDGAQVGEPVALEEPVCLGLLPLMLHSRHCLLHGLPAPALRELGECPHDQGGYFVVDGKEKVIVTREDAVRNRLYIRDNGPADAAARMVGKMTCSSESNPMPRTVALTLRPAHRRHAAFVEVPHLVRSALPPGAAARPTATAEPPLQVPLFVLFRALGVESDRAIMEHVVYDVAAPQEADLLELLRASALEAAAAGVMTQAAAVAWLAPHTQFGTPDDLKRVFVEDLFPNVGASLPRKALLLGAATRDLLRAALGKEAVPDRDDYRNKRLRVSGALLGDLFRNLYYRLRDRLLRRLDVEWFSGAWRSRGGPLEARLRALVHAANVGALVQDAVVTEGVRMSFKGVWGGRELEGLDAVGGADDPDNGVVQDLNRMSYLTYVSHVRRVNNPIDRSVKLAAPHRLLASHWGAVCPVESPDGPSIGLLKHLALLCEISAADEDAAPLRAELTARGLWEPLAAFEVASAAGAAGALRALRTACRVLVNDTWEAVTRDPHALVQHVRALRRAGAPAAPRTVSVAWDIMRNEVLLHTDAGRCCRPLARVSYGGSEGRVAALGTGAGAQAWRGLFARADGEPPMELVDVEELRSLLVAMRPSDLARRAADRFTHCELHPISMMSVVTATYPLMHHNNAAYNVLCLAQFKQALGVYATSFLARMDTLGAVMHYAQRPLVSSRVAERLCRGQHAHGQNLVVAVATYTGYNMEDAVIVNRDAVERGLFNLTLYKTHRFEEEADPDQGAALVFANPLHLEASGQGPVQGVRADASYAHLGAADGLPARDAHVGEGDVLLGCVQVQALAPGPGQAQGQAQAQAQAQAQGQGRGKAPGAVHMRRVDRSVRASRALAGVVDRVLLYPMPEGRRGGSGAGGGGGGGGGALDRAARVCKVRMRQVRAPELGDKVASRFGQKGVVGLLLPACDMPFSAQTGVVPDLIINPMGFPKRMTVAHLLECLLSKAGALQGRRYTADTFDPVDVPRDAGDALQALGLARSGCEVMVNGRSGEPMDADVFLGVNYYGRLKHMAADKVQQRSSRGRVNALVRQPVKAEGESGGLRLGEMEQNALLAHGLAQFTKEAFMERSDAHRSVLDARAGVPGGPRPWGDARDELPARTATVAWPYAFKLLHQELGAMCIDARFDDLDAPGAGAGPSDPEPPAPELAGDDEDPEGGGGGSSDDEDMDAGDAAGQELGADGDGGRVDS